MDSQLTLVDPHSLTPPEENIVFIFDDDDMLNTVLRIRGNNLPSYVVKTLRNTTTIYAGDCLLATVKCRIFGRDQITFPGSNPMDLERWLKAPKRSPYPLVFHAQGRRFEWQKNSQGQLVLRESRCPDDIVASFSPCSRHPRRHGHHATYASSLTVKPEMSEMEDMIVLSCLLAVHKLRVASAELSTTAVMCMMLIY